jgi:hypothetical protein
MARIAPSYRWGACITLVVVTFAVSSCGLFTQRTPGPDFKTSFDLAPPALIAAHIKKLKFDGRDAVSDERNLPLDGQPGPRVAIWPEKHSHKNKYSSLAKGPGRIIAKLINRDAQGYPELNLLPRDTVYWVVYGVKRMSDSLSVGRSLWISDSLLRGKGKPFALEGPVYIDHHPGQESYKQPSVRWKSYDKPGPGGAMMMPQGQQREYLAAWGACVDGGCCRKR